MVKLADIWDFHVPVAAILDCSRSGHQGHTPTCLRWFLESFYPYLSPYQISKTCHQVHDLTFIWHIHPLLIEADLKQFSERVSAIAIPNLHKFSMPYDIMIEWKLILRFSVSIPIITIFLKYVSKIQVSNNIPSLVQIKTWHLPGDKPLSETMILLTHICVTRPQIVK